MATDNSNRLSPGGGTYTTSPGQAVVSSSHKGLIGIAVVTVFLAAVLLTAWIALRNLEAETRKNAGAGLETVLLTTQEAIYMWADKRKEEAAVLAASPELAALTKQLLRVPRNPQALKNSAMQEKIRDFARPSLSKRKDLGIFIIAPDNISIASMRDENLGTENLIAQQRNRLLAQAFKGKVLLIPTIRSDVPLTGVWGRVVDKYPTLFVAAPIRDADGKVLAVFTIRLDPLQNFTRITQLGRIGKSGETYAFDNNGWLLTESRFNDQLRRAGLLKSNEPSTLAVRVCDPGGNMISGFQSAKPHNQCPLTAMAAKAVSGASGVELQGYRDYRGVTVLGAWLWDQELGFGLATEINADEALQPYYSTRLITLTVIMVTVLLSLVLTSFLVLIRVKAEKQLQHSFEMLDIRVQERTSELSAINERLHQEVVERVRTEEQLKQVMDELSRANEKLEDLANLDGLTGLPNRRFFNQSMESEWRRARREQFPIALIMMDIDYFKTYNDAYGHQAGDECLKKVGKLLSSGRFAQRPGDLTARYGGEEFAAILSNASTTDALEIAESIRLQVVNADMTHTATKVPGSVVTLSLGVASITPQRGSAYDDLIALADQALYKAKAGGRNRVESG